MEKFIYVDNSATTKINSQVLVKMMPYLTDYYGNASTTYNLGKKSKEAIDESRRIIARILKVNPKEIYFTTSGTVHKQIIWQFWALQGQIKIEVIIL